MRTVDSFRRFVRTIEGDARLDRITAPLDAAAASTARPEVGPVLRGEWLGHALHPLMTDLPLGCWMSAGALDLVGGRRSRCAAQRLIGIGLLAVPLTVATGVAEYDTIERQDVRRVGAIHAIGNTLVAALYLVSWRQRRRGHHLRGVVFGLGGGLLAWVTGYLGGHLSFARGTGVEVRGDLDELTQSGDMTAEDVIADRLEGRTRAHLVDVAPDVRIAIVEN